MTAESDRLIVLTGASGFVGRHILRELLTRGQRVRVLLRNAEGLGDILNNQQIDVIRTADLFKEPPERIKVFLADSELLIHAAWYTEPQKYLESPLNLHCLTGTLRLAEVFFQSGARRRFVGIGSCSEYDSSSGILSTTTPLKPTNLYSACKVAAFEVLAQLASHQNKEFAWCRLFYLHGDGEDDRRLVPYIRKQLKTGKPALLTKGTQIRDFMNITDAARMITEIANGGLQGPFNICSGRPVSIREMAEKIANEYGRKDLLKFGGRPENPYDAPVIVGHPHN